MKDPECNLEYCKNKEKRGRKEGRKEKGRGKERIWFSGPLG
jgi:hypothetical protein